MSTHPDPDAAAPEPNTAPAPPAADLSPDDDFDGEELGERQPGVCSLDEGCTVCQ